MDIRRLRYFIALAETLNFHRAAHRLHLSQPPLSVAIRKLEEDLGVRLFERGAGRGVELTDAGRAILPAARGIIAQMARMRESARQLAHGERGKLHVGYVGSAAAGPLRSALPLFRSNYPQIDLELDELTSRDIEARLDAGMLDVGFVRLPLATAYDLDVELIERDHLVAVLPTTHPLAARECLALAELADTPFIVQDPASVLYPLTMQACRHAGFVPRVAQKAFQVQTIFALVQSGVGVALAPSRMGALTSGGVRMLPLDRPITIEMGIACRSDAPPIARNFVEMVLRRSDTESVSATAH